MRHAFVLHAVLLTAAGLLAGGVTRAQQWPAKPVRLVVANSPGSATDIAARVFANNLSLSAGQAVAVENRPGADGYIGAEAVAKSAADGYTLFFASQSVFAIDPNIKKTMPVDPDKDFTPIAVMIDDSGATAIFAHPSQSFTTLQELVAFARANPGKLSFATSVPLFGMIGEWINRRAGIEMLEIRYKTSGQANQDALAGRVSMIITAFGPFEQHVKAGKIRVLAVTRSVADWPQIPTVASVWPDFNQPSFIILAGPGGMAPELVQRINRAAAAVVEDPKYNKDLTKLRWRNLEGARTPQGTAAVIREGRAAWAVFVKQVGITPQ